MILDKDFEDFIALLNKHEVRYIVVGGYAAIFHGSPRHTGDLDIWIKPEIKNAKKIVSVLNEFGMSSLGLTEEDFIKENFISQIGYPPLRIDILNSISGVDFDEAEKEIQVYQEGELPIKIISLKNLIENKMAAARKKDLADAEFLKKVQKKKK